MWRKARCMEPWEFSVYDRDAQAFVWCRFEREQTVEYRATALGLMRVTNGTVEIDCSPTDFWQHFRQAS